MRPAPPESQGYRPLLTPTASPRTTPSSWSARSCVHRIPASAPAQPGAAGQASRGRTPALPIPKRQLAGLQGQLALDRSRETSPLRALPAAAPRTARPRPGPPGHSLEVLHGDADDGAFHETPGRRWQRRLSSGGPSLAQHLGRPLPGQSALGGRRARGGRLAAAARHPGSRSFPRLPFTVSHGARARLPRERPDTRRRWRPERTAPVQGRPRPGGRGLKAGLRAGATGWGRG